MKTIKIKNCKFPGQEYEYLFRSRVNPEMLWVKGPEGNLKFEACYCSVVQCYGPGSGNNTTDDIDIWQQIDLELGELTKIGEDDDTPTKKICMHEECDKANVLPRMDKDSALWYYCKKCGDWTRKFGGY